MYCQKCGSENNDENSFCSKCGIKLGHIDNVLSKNEEPETKTPIALIATSWILFALCFIDQFLAENNFGLVIVLDIAAIICAILMLANKNKTAKVNGIIILSIWALCFILIVLDSCS